MAGLYHRPATQKQITHLCLLTKDIYPPIGEKLYFLARTRDFGKVDITWMSSCIKMAYEPSSYYHLYTRLHALPVKDGMFDIALEEAASLQIPVIKDAYSEVN